MGKSQSFGKRKGKHSGGIKHHHNSKPQARAVDVQKLGELDQLHRIGGQRLGKAGVRHRRFEKRTARDQRQRIEKLNDQRDVKKRFTKAEKRARHGGSEHEWTKPFDRDFWTDPTSLTVKLGGALPWREAILGDRLQPLKLERKSLGVLVKGDCPPPIYSAEDPALPPIFAAFFTACGFEKPSRVQQQCWPAALTGADVLGIAPTGSGKTVAYLLPAAPHIAAQLYKRGPMRPEEGPIALVLVPTRELANQVAIAARPLAKLCKIRSLAVYGGGRDGKDLQLEALLSVHHLLVSTPGRLVELLACKAVVLDRVTMLTIDEADRMLELGFEPQLETISAAIRPDRQTMLFSATFPGKLRAAAARWLGGERTVSVRIGALQVSAPAGHPSEAGEEGEGGGGASKHYGQSVSKSAVSVSRTIKQVVRVCTAEKKMPNLVALIKSIVKQECDMRQLNGVLVFCNRIKTVRSAAETLGKLGVHTQNPQPCH